MNKRWRWLLLAALLLGAGLRFYRLGAQSFWNDEGNTARLVERSVRLIVEGAAGDIHPPGYYLLLAGWGRGAGYSEFVLRGFSAFCGVLTIAAAAALGRRVGGRAAAFGAAWLVAVHPLAVYYSQEARMYALLGLLSALTLLAAANYASRIARQRARAVDGALLTLCMAAGLYTQYAFAFVLAGINLAFGITWLAQRPWRWRAWLPWMAAQVAGGLMFIPWLPAALKVTTWQPPDLNTGNALGEMARTLLVGVTLPAEYGAYMLPLAGALLLLALCTRPRIAYGKWAALCTALLPSLLIAALGVYRPAYLKFLMVSIAPLGALLALPLRQLLARRAAPLYALALLALLPAQIQSLHHLYHDPVYARADYRGIAASIVAAAGPGDAILLDAPNQWEVFTYYYKGPLPVHPAIYHPQPEEIKPWMEATVLADAPAQLFTLYWGDQESDPHRRIEGYLAEWTYKAGEQWVDDIRLARYGVLYPPPITLQSPPLNTRLGDAIVLEGGDAPARVFAPGEIIPVTLFWRAAAAPGERYKVFIHLLDASGALAAQNDMEPVAGFRPTDGWQPGELLIDRHGVLLPRDLPPGMYTLNVGLYRFSGERLPVTPAGDAVELGLVEILDLGF